jgi:AmmeMemoRadiSam system protein A
LTPPQVIVKDQPVYSPEERAQLIQLAHQAIESALAGRPLELKAPSEHLSQQRAAFTTLHLEGELRGCVGFVAPMYPLYRTIAETALAAAFEDNRFPPVNAEEAPRLKVEISVLSPLVPIHPEEVVVGKHGLVVSHHGRRGLLLPQVPVEHGWNRDTFIAETCRKAGLPKDAVLHGATLEAFTAEVFGE